MRSQPEWKSFRLSRELKAGKWVSIEFSADKYRYWREMARLLALLYEPVTKRQTDQRLDEVGGAARLAKHG